MQSNPDLFLYTRSFNKEIWSSSWIFWYSSCPCVCPSNQNLGHFLVQMSWTTVWAIPMALSFWWTHGHDIFSVAYEFMGILQGSLSLRLTHIIVLLFAFLSGSTFYTFPPGILFPGGRGKNLWSENSYRSQKQDLCFPPPKSSKPYTTVTHPACLTIRIVGIFASRSLGNMSWGLGCPNRNLDVGNTAPPWTCERFHMDSSPSFVSALRVSRRYPQRF